MRLQSLAPWWLVAVYAGIALALGGWQLWKRHGNRAELLTGLRRLVLLLLLVGMLLGPSVPGGSSAPGVANLDVLVAVDVTPSMEALDYAGTAPRLDGAKQDLTALATRLPGAHFEIITFDTHAGVVLPFTADPSALTAAIQGLTPQISSYSQGSAIDKPLELVTQELKNSKTAHPERSRLLFYLGDGEQTAEAPVKSFAPAAPYLNGGAVLGYGTAKGARMLRYNGFTAASAAPSYITTVDPTTKKLVPAVSKLDETALRKIAGDLKLAYRNRDRAASINDVYQASKTRFIVDHSRHVSRYVNLYWLLALPLGGLLFWEWRQVNRQLRDINRKPGAGSA